MRFRIALCIGLAAAAALPIAPTRASGENAPNQFAKYIYPLAKPLPAPNVTIDVTDVPEALPWAEQARALVREWFPLVCQLLATERYKPPKTLKLTFRKEIPAPAYSTGDEITINGKWIHDHPDDFGMVIHEMTHVIQAYPPGRANKPGWLVEGIADYIRWWRYEPESPRTPIDPQRASYRDSYRTTAAFLAWVVGKYNRALVPELDRALRSRSYTDDLFKQLTGKSLDDLWSEFVGTIRR
jgi:hypothetical protein